MTGLFERKKRAKSAQLTVRLDEQLKKRAELRLEAMGMTATEAVEQLYRFIAEHGRMPLQIRIVTEDALPVSPDKRQHAVSGAAAEQALLDNTNFRVFYASGNARLRRDPRRSRAALSDVPCGAGRQLQRSAETDRMRRPCMGRM